MTHIGGRVAVSITIRFRTIGFQDRAEGRPGYSSINSYLAGSAFIVPTPNLHATGKDFHVSSVSPLHTSARM